MINTKKDFNIMYTKYKHKYDIKNPILISKIIDKKQVTFKAYRCIKCGRVTSVIDYDLNPKDNNIIKGCINSTKFHHYFFLLGMFVGAACAMFAVFAPINKAYAGICAGVGFIFLITYLILLDNFKFSEKININIHKLQLIYAIDSIITKKKKIGNAEYNKALRLIKTHLKELIEDLNGKESNNENN